MSCHIFVFLFIETDKRIVTCLTFHKYSIIKLIYTFLPNIYSPHSYLHNLVKLIHQSHDNFPCYDISMCNFENLSRIENILLQTYSPCILLISDMLFFVQTNSFRAILTTDNRKTFVIFKYDDINWTRARNADSHAMVSKLMLQVIVTINCSGV